MFRLIFNKKKKKIFIYVILCCISTHGHWYKYHIVLNYIIIINQYDISFLLNFIIVIHISDAGAVK